MENLEYGTTLQNEKYHIKITTAHTYIEGSVDNRSYDHICPPRHNKRKKSRKPAPNNEI